MMSIYCSEIAAKTNLENFVLRERLVDKNGWQDYVYQADECALHIYITYVRATGIINDFATTSQVQNTAAMAGNGPF